ncbi:MAG: hypothetical protein P8129_20550 [Anaerolineae bacterium]
MASRLFDEWLGGLDRVRIPDAGYGELTAGLEPGKIYKRTRT